ncbi:MAG: sugar phosphate isomerase/epimerase [Proteobacteria bacterium]|nr:sugar phosphate isomerase/epimerase [Pseudomonadota bacterium]
MNDKRVQCHIPYPILIERFDEVCEAALNPEVYIDAESLALIESGINSLSLGEISETLRAKGLRSTIHGPFMDMSPGGVDEGVRELTQDQFSRLIESTKELRPEAIVLHGGYDERYYDGDSALWLAQSLKTWRPLAGEAESAGTVLAIENIFEERPGTLKELVEAIDSPSLRICLDIGHINLYSAVEMKDWFATLGPYIAELHIHDNLGVVDDHLPIGEGTIDFPLFFSLVRGLTNKPIYTIEPHGEGVLKRALEAVGAYL